MDHMNEILQLLDNIIVCGNNITKLGTLLKEIVQKSPQNAKAEPIIESDTIPVDLPEEEDAEVKTYTFIDVRKAFSAKSHAGYTAQIKELISKYGANRLSDVKEEDYPALMADLEVIG